MTRVRGLSWHQMCSLRPNVIEQCSTQLTFVLFIAVVVSSVLYCSPTMTKLYKTSLLDLVPSPFVVLDWAWGPLTLLMDSPQCRINTNTHKLIAIFRNMPNTQSCTIEPAGKTICVLTLKVLVATIDAQWEGVGDVGSARYELPLLPPCPTIRVLSYSN